MREGSRAELIVKRGYVIHNGMPVRGHIILTPRYVCFWRRMLMSPDIKVKCNDLMIC
jgi:sterol 3beta-glucosyltransferase